MAQLSYLQGGMDVIAQSSETQKTNKYWTFIYVKSGAGLYILEGRLRVLNDGDLIIIPPRISYSFMAEDLEDEYNENMDASVLQFGETWLNGLLGVFRTLGEVVLKLKEMKSAMSAKGKKWLRMSSLMADLKTCQPSIQPLKIIELIELFKTSTDFYPITGETLYDKVNTEDKVVRIKRYIGCHLLNRITLDEISEYTGMNRTYFCLFFKKHFGTGLTDYINQERMKKASSLLGQGYASVSDVARECGFPNVTYFNRVFRKNYGMSPTEYRNKVQEA